MAEYINRTALLFAMDDYFHGTDPDGEEQIGVLKMRSLVRTFGAADVAPVVHGRWETEIEYDELWGDLDYYKCSLCGNRELRDKQTPYCPNCGARMDGE